MVKSSLKIIFLVLTISTTMVGYSTQDTKTELKKSKGVGLTYSEYFKNLDGLDKRETITYYEPVSIDQLESSLTEPLADAVGTIDHDQLPFEVKEGVAFLVTSEDAEEKLTNQVQLSYLSKSEYDRIEDFLIISITEVKENPLKGLTNWNSYDSVGNELRKESLTEDIPIFHQVITTNSALVYSYYDYDDTNNRVVTVGTAANEFYCYYKGYVYHVGYFIDRKKNNRQAQKDMLQLTRDYILGNSF